MLDATVSRRAARVLIAHAVLTLVVLAATIAVLLWTQRSVSEGCCPTGMPSHTVTLVRLGVTAPIWGLIAWQVVRLRQLHAGRSLDVAAVAAVVAGLAAIATSAVAGPAMWHEDRARFAALIELAAASVWFVETAYALGRVAERLAASPVALAKSYQRHRAAWVAGTFTILPLLFGAAAGAAAFLQPAAGASFGAAVVVWFAYNHVELARLLAASCDLPEASAVERHT